MTTPTHKAADRAALVALMKPRRELYCDWRNRDDSTLGRIQALDARIKALHAEYVAAHGAAAAHAMHRANRAHIGSRIAKELAPVELQRTAATVLDAAQELATWLDLISVTALQGLSRRERDVPWECEDAAQHCATVRVALCFLPA